MFFTLLLGLSALLVAGSAAYFSVLGIATLFSGSYIQVMIMAGALEFGKLVATSYLYRYWNKTIWWLKLYLIVAVLVLMGITSIGLFGYLSAAYQVNSSKYQQIDTQILLLDAQKASVDKEIDQINSRVEVLNKTRISQEQRLPTLTRTSAARVYTDIENSSKEIKDLNERVQHLQEAKSEKDQQIIGLKSEITKTKDIGTFKFIASAINRPLDTVVIAFICVLIGVFDPLAVALVLAFNVATSGKILKEDKSKKDKPKEEPEKKPDTELESPQLLSEVIPDQLVSANDVALKTTEPLFTQTEFSTSAATEEIPVVKPRNIGIKIL